MGKQFLNFLCLGSKSGKFVLIFSGKSLKSNMTRGNQRDLAREKNLKKQQKGKSANDTAANAGLTVGQRKERDAKIMRKKLPLLLKKRPKNDTVFPLNIQAFMPNFFFDN